MSKFRKKQGNDQPEISTASLPDIIFMLLFFFMVVTVMKENPLKVDVIVPTATELEKLEPKSLVHYIYIGKPKPQFEVIYVTAPRIQLNDAFADKTEIVGFVRAEREKVSEAERDFLTTSLRVDKTATMGIISDVKTELRKVNQLRVNYSSSIRTDKL